MRLVVLAALAACNGFSHPDQPGGDAHPVANPGTGSSYPRGATVTLDGSHSFDPSGAIASYHWEVAAQPMGSTSVPADPAAAMTTFVLDEFGTYRLRLVVTDDAGNSDTNEIRLVSLGAIQELDAGVPGTVAWLGTAHLAGSATVAPGHVPTYAWSFASVPAGSTTTLQNPTTLSPSFVADAAGTYVLAFDVTVGDDTREDTVTVEATATSFPVGAGVAYIYAPTRDRILYVQDVAHAELAAVDPVSGATVTADLGGFTPRTLAIDDTDQYVAIGGPGKVATATLSTLLVTGVRDAPGCSAAQVTMPYSSRVDCYPADGSIEPISSVNMSTGEIIQGPSPARFPFLALTNLELFMIDGASPDLYVIDGNSTPPGHVNQHVTVPGITPPIIGLGTNQPYVLVGNGYALDASGTLRYDLHMPVSAAAASPIAFELAVVSGTAIRVFSFEQQNQPMLTFSAVVPPVNGMTPTTKLVAYTSDGHRLIIVAGTAAGDVAFTVPR